PGGSVRKGGSKVLVDIPGGRPLPLEHLSQPDHPLTLAFTLLSQAFWSRSQEALNKAADILRDIYIKGLITPFDIGHTFFLLRTFVDIGWVYNEKVDMTTKQRLED